MCVSDQHDELDTVCFPAGVTRMFSPLLLSLVVKLRTVVLPYFLPEVKRPQLRAGALLGGSVGVSSLKASDWRSAERKRKSSSTSAEKSLVDPAA